MEELEADLKRRAFAEQHYCKPNLSKAMDAHPKGEGPRGPALQPRADYNRAVSCIASRIFVVLLGWICEKRFQVSGKSRGQDNWEFLLKVSFSTVCDALDGGNASWFLFPIYSVNLNLEKAKG